MNALQKLIGAALLLALLMGAASCGKTPPGSTSSNSTDSGASSREESQTDSGAASEDSHASSSESGTASVPTGSSGTGQGGDDSGGTGNGPNTPSTGSRPGTSGGTSSNSFTEYNGPVLNFRNPGDTQTVGVWWWTLGDITSGDCDKYLDFLSKNKVSEIYLCVDRMGSSVSAASVRPFVKKAGQKGMRVAALTGDVSWITPGNTGFDNFVKKFNDYQKDAASDEKFYAMHLDVEPHQRDDFSTNRAAILQMFADLLTKKARPAATAAGTLLEWDIPFWFTASDIVKDGSDSLRLDELMAKKCDTVAVMSYRDTAAKMYDVAKEEIQFAKKYGTKIILGAETYSTEGNAVSYMEEGKIYMNTELVKLKGLLDTAVPSKKYGIAIHQHKRWYDLKNQ